MMPMTQPTAEQTRIPPQIASWYCDRAWLAMLTEVNLTPKPGLVDRHNCGAHKDMALADFHRSADVIRQWLPRFMEQGAACAGLTQSDVLSRLRPIGLGCESAMYQVTAGVNTHKGTVFSLGLLCAAIGYLYELRQPISPESVCTTVATFCQGLTWRELSQHNNLQTAGQRLYQEYGLTGARGEAEAGYPLVITRALPHYRARLTAGSDPEIALLDTLLLLMAHNGDTNVASRGGSAGLSWLQQQARHLLDAGGIRQPDDLHHLQDFDRQCIARNLSPGGSADLLIVTWFLAQVPAFNPAPALL